MEVGNIILGFYWKSGFLVTHRATGYRYSKLWGAAEPVQPHIQLSHSIPALARAYVAMLPIACLSGA